MSRAQLIGMARDNIAHAKAGTINQVSDVARVPAAHYYDPQRWRLEMDRVFKRMPLMLALSVELAKPGDYRAIEAAGVPVLLLGHPDGAVRAFVNMCSHRGSQIMPEGAGNSRRFTCPYHGLTIRAARSSRCTRARISATSTSRATDSPHCQWPSAPD